jgi:hypothetical protein
MTTRERHITIRWTGDESTEAALLKAVGLSCLPPVPGGECERWMAISERHMTVAIAALEGAGAMGIKS